MRVLFAIIILSGCTYPGTGYNHIQPENMQKPLKVNCVKYQNNKCISWELK